MERPVRARCQLREQRSPKLWLASLPNGAPTFAHLSEACLERASDLRAGQWVEAELTPYDFSQARIVARSEKP
ncbi:MAG: hypothetical protein AAF555_10790 [Verrucomicrobiota bacterium]